MASLRRKPRSPFYYACFRMPDGRRVQRSTGQSNQKKAQSIADKWEQAARDRMTEDKSRALLSEIHQLLRGSPLPSATVSEFAERWIAAKTHEVEAVTLASYKTVTKALVSHLGTKADQAIDYITREDVAAFRDATLARTSPRTANNQLKVVRTFFQSAWRDGLISENPAAKVPVVKAGKSSRRPFTLPELKSVLAVCDDEWRGIVIAGLYTGQRLKDVASLTWAHVDLVRQEIRFSTSKTDRRQEIPIASPLLAYLESLPASDKPNAPIFPSAHKIATGNRDTSALSQAFHTILVSAGLAQPRPKIKASTGVGRGGRRTQNALSFHSLRHTATSLLKNAGVSEAVVRDLIGHDSELVSRHYTHIELEPKRKALAKLPDVTS